MDWTITPRSRVPAAALALLFAISGLSCSRGDGGGEEAAGAWTPQKPEFLQVARRLKGGKNPYLGRAWIGELEGALAAQDLPERRRVALLSQLAFHHLRLGDVDAGVGAAERAWDMVQADPSLQAEDGGAELAELLAMAWLRKAEVQNCVLEHNPQCCSFPLEGGGRHAAPEPARRAMETYELLMRLEPDALQHRWLYNLTAMAVGIWPEGVPEAALLPPSVFASEIDVGRFVDVAPELGVAVFSLCGGAIAEDLDGDGRLDIVASSFDPEGPLAAFRSDGRGGFEDVAASWRLDDQLGGLNCISGDYDGDGDSDILVLRGAWLHRGGRIRNSLLRNDGGLFTDVTRQAGLADPALPTQTATWGDFDLDGDLDLYVGNESMAEVSDQEPQNPSQLFRNEGDGTFVDVARGAGVTNDGFAKGVCAGDYDNDGDLDLYVSNNAGPNRLYRNDGGLRFTDVAAEAGVTEPLERSFACWFFDYDADGWLDLFVAGFDASVADVAADYLGLPWEATTPRLYRNRRDGTFEDVAADVGLARPFLPMGADFGDLDNDGWLDIYLTTGDPDYRTLMPNVLLRNDRGRRFQDVTRSAGVGHLQKGHGVAFADLDEDGDQDIYHELGGFYPGDAFANALFLNPGHGNRFLTVELRGVRSNREGRGARVTVTIDTPSGQRQIHRAPGSVSSFGGSPIRQEIGMGDATAIRRLEVWWPASGIRQGFADVPLDSRVRVIEGEDEIEVLPMRTVSFR